MSEKSSFFNSINEDRPYDSEDFAAFFAAFFTNGIFNNGLQVISNFGMSIALSEGIANNNGYRYKNDGNKILNITNADGVLNRIDNVVIRLDLPNRKVTAEVVQGEFSENAVAPDLIRDNTIYDLRVAKISIPAGTVEITQDLIEDTRFNSEDCGNVICAVQTPDFTDALIQYTAIWNKLVDDQSKGFQDWFEDVKGQLDGDVAGNLLNLINKKSDIPTSKTITLATTGWVLNEETGYYEYDVVDESITENDYILVDILDKEQEEVMANTKVDTANGNIKFTSEEQIDTNVELQVVIMRTKAEEVEQEVEA